MHQAAHGFGIGFEPGVKRIARGKPLHDGRLARIEYAKLRIDSGSD